MKKRSTASEKKEVSSLAERFKAIAEKKPFDYLLFKAIHTPNLPLSTLQNVVKQLLEAGANIHAVNSDNHSVLILAAKRNDQAVIQMLLTMRAGNLQDLGWAIAAKHHFLVSCLIEEGKINLNSIDQDGWSPLASAIFFGHFSIAQILMNAGANIKEATAQLSAYMTKEKPEHIKNFDLRKLNQHILTVINDKDVSEANCADIVSTLLALGANPNVKNEQQQTAVILAAKMGRPWVTKILLTAGAKTDFIKEILALANNSYYEEMHAQGRVIVVNLDLRCDGSQFKQFFKLSALEQIEKFKKRISDICENLQLQEPDALWIMVWREYAILDGLGKRSVLPAIKQEFKKVMQRLTEQYPNLTLIAGTISTRKHYDNLEQLNHIQKYYRRLGWIKEIERATFSSHDQGVLLHEKDIEELKQKMPTNGFDAIRNTCYVFSAGKIFGRDSVWRHSKMAPFEELKYNEVYGENNSIYQPGKGRSQEQILEIEHPKTKKRICLGVEICRESLFGILSRHANKMPFIHFIMSASVGLSLEHLYGSYIVQADSLSKPIVLKSFRQLNADIQFFHNNLLSASSILNPIIPCYSFPQFLLDKIDLEIIEKGKNRNLIAIRAWLIRCSAKYFWDFFSYDDEAPISFLDCVMGDWGFNTRANQRLIFWFLEAFKPYYSEDVALLEKRFKDYYADHPQSDTTFLGYIMKKSDAEVLEWFLDHHIIKICSYKNLWLMAAESKSGIVADVLLNKDSLLITLNELKRKKSYQAMSDIIFYLQSLGKDVVSLLSSKLDDYANTLLHRAAHEDNLKMANWLLSQHVKADLKNADHETPLLIVCSHATPNPEFLDLLLAHKADALPALSEMVKANRVLQAKALLIAVSQRNELWKICSHAVGVEDTLSLSFICDFSHHTGRLAELIPHLPSLLTLAAQYNNENLIKILHYWGANRFSVSPVTFFAAEKSDGVQEADVLSAQKLIAAETPILVVG